MQVRIAHKLLIVLLLVGLVPMAAAASGLDFNALVRRILETTL